MAFEYTAPRSVRMNEAFHRGWWDQQHEMRRQEAERLQEAQRSRALRGALTSPPLPRVMGYHWTFSRPPGAQWRYGHEFHSTGKFAGTSAWQFLGWQLTVSPCPECQH